MKLKTNIIICLRFDILKLEVSVYSLNDSIETNQYEIPTSKYRMHFSFAEKTTTTTPTKNGSLNNWSFLLSKAHKNLTGIFVFSVFGH